MTEKTSENLVVQQVEWVLVGCAAAEEKTASLMALLTKTDLNLNTDRNF